MLNICPTHQTHEVRIMKKTWIAGIAGSALILSLATTGVGLAKSGTNEPIKGSIRVKRQAEAEFPALAKISMAQAMDAALAAVPGKVLKAELDDENGFLLYEIEVVTANKTVMEIKVDAGDGKILATKQDK